MKKLIVFRRGVCPESDEVEDYLHSTEVLRSDFIDMSPEREMRNHVGDLAQYVSDWNVIFKDDETYDQWHIHFDTSCKVAGTLLEQYRAVGVCQCIVVLRGDTSVVAIYRIPKAISKLFSEHLPQILESYSDEHGYSFRIDESSIESLRVEEEPEAPRDMGANTRRSGRY